MQSTVQVLRDHIRENRLDGPEQFGTPLFHNARHQRLSRSGIRYILHKYLVRARSACPGLDRPVSPHTLRHTAATWLMQRGVSIWQAAGYLGMSPETLDRVYGHHSPDYLKGAAHAITSKNTANVSVVVSVVGESEARTKFQKSK